jgi:hypothetical protein
MKKIIFIAAVLFLAGCATQPASLPQSWTYTGTDAVTVVAAVGISTDEEFKSVLPYHLFRVSSSYSKEKMTITTEYDPGFRNSVTDYQTPEGRYGVVKLTLKPGIYQIDSIRSYSPSPYGGVTLSSNESFNIPVTLAPGKVYYLGTFTAHNINVDGAFGSKQPVGAFWVANTQATPNRDAINKKYPELINTTLESYPGDIVHPPYFFKDIADAKKLLRTD